MSVRLAEPNLEAIDEGGGIKESRKKKDHQPLPSIPGFADMLLSPTTVSTQVVY